MEDAAGQSVTCPGCAGAFPDVAGLTHRYMESSPGCWAAYGVVLAREYGNQVYFAVHRLGVDAYAVQHPGRPSAQSMQSVGVHLIRLHLLLERGLSAAKANDAMLAAARFKRGFTWLEPPAHFAVTVADVVGARSVEQHEQAVRAWAAAWQAWSPHHETIRRWTAQSSAGASGAPRA